MSEENRKERFRRIASRRTTNVLNQLRLLGNLSNKANYDYEEGDVRRILSAIKNQLRMVEAKFQTRERKDFKL